MKSVKGRKFLNIFMISPPDCSRLKVFRQFGWTSKSFDMQKKKRKKTLILEIISKVPFCSRNIPGWSWEVKFVAIDKMNIL